MAQFIVKPPLTVVGSVFSAATGRNLSAGVSWIDSQAITGDLLETVRSYIRPCHQSIVDRAAAGDSPIPLLRQLLRPHGLRIEKLQRGWRVVDPAHPCVAHTPGATVVWD